jgi:hypothetical protein
MKVEVALCSVVAAFLQLASAFVPCALSSKPLHIILLNIASQCACIRQKQTFNSFYFSRSLHASCTSLDLLVHLYHHQAVAQYQDAICKVVCLIATAAVHYHILQ